MAKLYTIVTIYNGGHSVHDIKFMEKPSLNGFFEAAPYGPSVPLELRYVDSDGDLIHITTEIEWDAMVDSFEQQDLTADDVNCFLIVDDGSVDYSREISQAQNEDLITFIANRPSPPIPLLPRTETNKKSSGDILSFIVEREQISGSPSTVSRKSNLDNVVPYYTAAGNSNGSDEKSPSLDPISRFLVSRDTELDKPSISRAGPTKGVSTDSQPGEAKNTINSAQAVSNTSYQPSNPAHSIPKPTAPSVSIPSPSAPSNEPQVISVYPPSSDTPLYPSLRNSNPLELSQTSVRSTEEAYTEEIQVLRQLGVTDETHMYDLLLSLPSIIFLHPHSRP